MDQLMKKTSNTNGVVWTEMESLSENGVERDQAIGTEDHVTGRRHRRIGPLRLLLAAAAVAIAIAGAVVVWYRRSRNPFAPQGQPYPHAHDESFPGLNNNTLPCAARLLVDLERAYSLQIPPRFATLLLDQRGRATNRCGDYFGVETFPEGCAVYSKFRRENMTLRDYIEHCIPKPMDAFQFWMDGCPAKLSWNDYSCEQVWNGDSSFATAQRIPLWNDMATGIVETSIVDGRISANILVPDPVARSSCWAVECGWDYAVSPNDCIQHAQDHLRHVSLEEYVSRVSKAVCD